MALIDINLDESEKVISLILGLISLIGIVLRKFIIPKAVKTYDLLVYWLSIPRRLKFIESIISERVILGIVKEIPFLHSNIYTLKHKCNFLLNDHTVPIYEFDLSGGCIWSNKALQNLFGLNFEQMLEDGWLSALHPQDIVPTGEKWKGSIENWLPYKALYRVINQKTKKIYHCEASAYPILDENSETISYMGRVEILQKEIYERS